MTIKNRIPLVDLRTQYDNISTEIDSAIKKVLKKANFILGEEVQKFEKKFAEFCKARFSVAVANGTDALFITLKSLGIKNDDEVITSPNTFIGTTEAITLCGAKPVFVDIHEKTFTIDESKIERAITEKTKVILPVHLYGCMCDMIKISKIAKKYKLKVVEDACQAHGSLFKTMPPGHYSDAACFSFFPGKNLGAYGDGGAVVTNNRKLYEKIKKFRNHGRARKYIHEFEGMNSRMDTLQAAILLVKLKYLKKWIQKRNKIARIYTQLLSNIREIQPPVVPRHIYHSWHLYVIKTPFRDKLKNFLESKNIFCGIHYPIPLHLQPAYKYLGYKRGDFPVAEKLSKMILTLPIYPELEYKAQLKICNLIKRFFKNVSK